MVYGIIIAASDNVAIVLFFFRRYIMYKIENRIAAILNEDTAA